MSKSKKFKDIVLIVEDVSESHEIIETFLTDIDVNCEHAYDGMEAVTKCSSLEPDYYSLILMDINLPHMNGVRTAEKLISMGIKAPIIAITATSKNDMNMIDRNKYFYSTLYKPFNYSDFYTAISPHIKNAARFPLTSEKSTRPQQDINSIDKRVCNISKGVSNMGNNRRLFIKHFNNFKVNNVDLYSRLYEFIDKGDYESAVFLCHSIKGIAGMLALTNLCSHIIDLELLLKDIIADGSFDVDEVSEMLLDIKDDILAVCRTRI